MKGSSYIPLPDVLKHKKAIINIKNDDEHCLRYTLRAALFPTSDHPQRINSYPKEDGLNFHGIKKSTPVSQICKVEKLNNLAINVYGWENNKVIIYRISNQPYDVKRINTLLLEQDEKSHYVLIKNLSRLLNSKNDKQMFYCERCLIGFTRDDLLQSHLVECRGINEQAVRIQMPTENNKSIKFVNHKKQLKAPWVIYADFESIIRKKKVLYKALIKALHIRVVFKKLVGFVLELLEAMDFQLSLFFIEAQIVFKSF